MELVMAQRQLENLLTWLKKILTLTIYFIQLTKTIAQAEKFQKNLALFRPGVMRKRKVRRRIFISLNIGKRNTAPNNMVFMEAMAQQQLKQYWAFDPDY